MADANTTLYGFVKPEVGASADTWGSKWNQNNDDYDGLLGAYTLTGSSNAYVLTTGMSLAAYADKQRFCVKWNHTNSGTATLNVDGLGAKTIKKRDASTNCSASDLVSGTYAIVTYDGTNFVLVTVVASDFQALDATLTALAALSWSSGSPLVQFTAADTVSLTLAPSVSSVTASQGAAATTASGSFKNTNDNASVLGVKIGGARATVATQDAAYAAWVLNNASGAEKEFGRQTITAIQVTAGAEVGLFTWSLMSAGTLTPMAYLSTATFRPGANDLIPLGNTTAAWADLFLASGAVINFNNGDVTITHSSDLLSVEGGDFQANLPLSSETSGTITVASANKHILASGGITLPNSVFAARNITTIDGNGTARTITRGSGVTMYVNGTDSATATLPANGLMGVYWRTASVCILTGNVS